MTDKKKAMVKKIAEIVVYLLVGAAAMFGIANFDNISKAFTAGESKKIEAAAQVYAADTVVPVTVEVAPAAK